MNEIPLFKEPSLSSAKTLWNSPLEISGSRISAQVCSPINQLLLAEAAGAAAAGCKMLSMRC